MLKSKKARAWVIAGLFVSGVALILSIVVMFSDLEMIDILVLMALALVAGLAYATVVVSFALPLVLLYVLWHAFFRQLRHSLKGAMKDALKEADEERQATPR